MNLAAVLLLLFTDNLGGDGFSLVPNTTHGGWAGYRVR